MNIFKSHFWYTKSQRNGIFALVILIIVFQTIIYYSNSNFNGNSLHESPEILAFHEQIDSLRKKALEKRKPKIYPFNPNYITDFKGATLGMSLDEIDRLLAFRKTGKFINSAKEFQQVTSISDSLLTVIAPYFKFPDWVKQKKTLLSSSFKASQQFGNNKPVYKVTTKDINKATAKDLQTISGIGVAFSERIIKYRSKLKGYSFQSQIYEVWGLQPDVAKKVIETFKILEQPIIKKENVNTITFKELLKNPYIDYNLCKKIFEYRDEVAELQNISELKNIKGFPLDRYDRIVLYLQAK